MQTNNIHQLGQFMTKKLVIFTYCIQNQTADFDFTTHVVTKFTYHEQQPEKRSNCPTGKNPMWEKLGFGIP